MAGRLRRVFPRPNFLLLDEILGRFHGFGGHAEVILLLLQAPQVALALTPLLGGDVHLGQGPLLLRYIAVIYVVQVETALRELLTLLIFDLGRLPYHGVDPLGVRRIVVTLGYGLQTRTRLLRPIYTYGRGMALPHQNIQGLVQ